MANETTIVKLNLGATEKPLDGWKNVNIVAGPHVDIVADITDLSSIKDNSVDEIHCSHVLEHIPDSKVDCTLRGICRIMKPGATLTLSVPDMLTLCDMFVRKVERAIVVAVLFGGHTDVYDAHQTGYWFDKIAYYLQRAGFTDITQVNYWTKWKDSSYTRVANIPISLNVEAKKPFVEAVQ